MEIKFDDNGWGDYNYWAKKDKNILKKINSLITSIKESPYSGVGKPEPLKHHFSGFWSRRINKEHRLVYAVKDDEVIIVQCRYHY